MEDESFLPYCCGERTLHMLHWCWNIAQATALLRLLFSKTFLSQESWSIPSCPVSLLNLCFVTVTSGKLSINKTSQITNLIHWERVSTDFRCCDKNPSVPMHRRFRKDLCIVSKLHRKLAFQKVLPTIQCWLKGMSLPFVSYQLIDVWDARNT